DPATFDRLPMSWYKKQLAALKQKMKEKEIDAIWLRDPLNITYFTGYFYVGTERPYSVLLPVNEDAIFWFHPALDPDLVDTWWKTDSEYYFDFLHAEGGFPNKDQVSQGNTVDLFAWQLQGLKKHGFAEKAIGVDNEWTPSAMAKILATIPKASWRDISDV